MQIKSVYLIGEDEIANDYITLKNMSTGEQQKVSNNELIKIIK